MNLPWMRLYTRDWLDNKELRRCSPTARAVLADLMCLAHEGERYGYLEDKSGPLTCDYMAARCVLTVKVFMNALNELVTHSRIKEKDGSTFVPRMVEDEAVRVRRAEGGKQSIGHPNTPPPRAKQGYPCDHPLPSEGTHPSPEIDSRARVGADSGSDSNQPQVGNGFAFQKTPAQTQKVPAVTMSRFQDWIKPWPRVPNEELAFQAFVFCWSAEEDAAIFACTSRYLRSAEVADGAISNPDKFLNEQKINGWKGQWPPPKPNGRAARKTGLQELMEDFGGAK